MNIVNMGLKVPCEWRHHKKKYRILVYFKLPLFRQLFRIFSLVRNKNLIFVHFLAVFVKKWKIWVQKILGTKVSGV